MALIDLDQPERNLRTSDGPHSRPRLWVVGVTCFAIGVGAGGASTYQWLSQKTQESRASTISIMALANFNAPDSASFTVWSDGRVTAASLSAHASIFNGGPMAVDLLTVSATHPGISLQGVGNGRSIDSGEVVSLPVEIQVECSASDRLKAIPVSISVKTAVGENRELSVTIGGEPWVRRVRTVCSGPGP